MKANLQLEVVRICKFLNVTISPSTMRCILQNSEGNFKREHDKHVDELAVFPEEIKKQLDADILEVNNAVANCQIKENTIPMDDKIRK